MKEVKFKIEKQNLQRIDEEKIMKGTKNYLECTFDFDRDWVGTLKVALFIVDGKELAIPIRSNKCMVPNELSNKVSYQLYVVGQKNGSRITTNKVLIVQGD